MVQARAKWAFHQAGITNFKASDGWYRRWINRWRRFGFYEDSKMNQMLGEPSVSSSDDGNYVNDVSVTSANIKERIISESNVDKVIEEKERSMSQDKAIELIEDKNCMEQTDKEEQNQTKHSESSCSKTLANHKYFSDMTNGGESSDKRNGKASCQRTDLIEVNEHVSDSATNVERCLDSGSAAMLSTPMLDIIDYLPPEIMHNLQCNLPKKLSYNNENGCTNSATVDNVFTTSDVDASIDCLYYPASSELSLQDQVLSDCENETLSNISNFPFELHHTDSYSFSTSMTAETERLKDIAGFISSQNNSSQSSLHNLAFSNIHNSENVISACSSEESEEVVNSVFKDVGLNVSGKEENSCIGVTVNTQSDILASVISHDVFAPEVILESHTPNAEQIEDADSRYEAMVSSSKKSRSCGVYQRKKGERYLPHFKVKVLAYAANHTLRETAKKFKVNDGTISSWKKEKDWKKQLSQNSYSSYGQNDEKKKMEVPSVCPVDQQFLTWLRRCREQGRELTAVEVKDKARQMVSQGTADSCHWFRLWVSRFDEEQVYQEDFEKMKRKQERHIQYPLAFKLEVAIFAEHHSQIVTARTFNVSRKRVFEWLQLHRTKFAKGLANATDRCSQAVKVEEDVPKKACSRRSDIDKEVDMEIWTWYQDQQAKGSKPSWHEVQAKGLKLYRGRGNENIKCSYRWYRRWCDRFHVVLRHEGDDAMLEWALTQLELGHSLSHNDLQAHALTLASDNAFKASPGWAIRFCKRHPELLQHSPSLDTALPGPLLQKVEMFRCELQKIVRDNSLSLDCVGNMDEVYLSFSALVSGSSSNAKRHLLVRRSEMENCHATIVLACLADGNILPPAVILKVSGLESETESPDGCVVVLEQEEGLMDASCMCQWLQQIWFKHVRNPNLLLLDCHEPHTGESIVAEFSTHQSNRLIIPGGCTSKLQPLDVSLKSMFHASIQKQWSMFNSHSSEVWDATGNKLQLPSRKEIVDWVTTAYCSLQAAEQETIRRSFLVTGLTVAANKSEDHFIENLSMIPRANNCV
ncbi:uncharacterized protein LOC110833118 isoform X2 [Zootermopsis nevadensis]|nr:uncharacterized protein LOC110833118 isoform X2 [Zootermopsis nevadensis]